MNVPSSGTISLPTVLPTARKPKCSDNFCQQECQDSPTQGAQCTCRDGYLLKPDKVSCQGKAAVLLNFYLDFVYSVSILQVNLAFVTAASYTQAPKGGAKACSELVFVFSYPCLIWAVYLSWPLRPTLTDKLVKLRDSCLVRDSCRVRDFWLEK